MGKYFLINFVDRTGSICFSLIKYSFFHFEKTFCLWGVRMAHIDEGTGIGRGFFIFKKRMKHDIFYANHD